MGVRVCNSQSGIWHPDPLSSPALKAAQCGSTSAAERERWNIQVSYLQWSAIHSWPWLNLDQYHIIKTQRPSGGHWESQLERRLKGNEPFPPAALVSAGGPRPSERAHPLQRGHTIINLQEDITGTVELWKPLSCTKTMQSHKTHPDKTSKPRTRRNGTETDKPTNTHTYTHKKTPNPQTPTPNRREKFKNQQKEREKTLKFQKGYKPSDVQINKKHIIRVYIIAIFEIKPVISFHLSSLTNSTNWNRQSKRKNSKQEEQRGEKEGGMQLAEEGFFFLRFRYTYTLSLLNMQCVVKKKNKDTLSRRQRHTQKEVTEHRKQWWTHTRTHMARHIIIKVQSWNYPWQLQSKTFNQRSQNVTWSRAIGDLIREQLFKDFLQCTETCRHALGRLRRGLAPGKQIWFD